MDVNEIKTTENAEIPETKTVETVETVEIVETTDTVEVTKPDEINEIEETNETPLVSFPEEKDVGEKAKLPFPQEDYDKNGKLKTVRKRMLKKLMKYEFRALFPYLLTLVALLFAFAIVFGVHIRLAQDVEKLKPWLVLTGMLYGFTNFGLFIVTYSTAHKRYKKNFFGDEGYLTFSIPASAEEHILAKHLSTLVCMAISWGSMVLSGAIFGLITTGWKTFSWIGPSFRLYGELFKVTPWHTLFFTIELLLLSVLFIPLIPCLMGAGTCWGQKHSEKSRFRKRLLYIIIGVIIYQAIQILLFTTGILSFVFSEVGVHLFLWFWVLVEAGLIVWALWYQRKTIKYNLNLQ
ncbi:MAG: hypothetical protein IJX30_05955 [Clostridia bacterium]|nr:hypothetical protein [Clostridia bacterium]